jgi:hypothetical protein
MFMFTQKSKSGKFDQLIDKKICAFTLPNRYQIDPK